jgi:hypothetical protein
MRMKRWESPRREGRNDKGKKNPARQRQIKKQTQALRLKLKGGDWRNQPGKSKDQPQNQSNNQTQGSRDRGFPAFLPHQPDLAFA